MWPVARVRCQTRVRNGRLHPIHRGVYAVGHASLHARRPLPRRGQGVRAGRGAEPPLGGGALGVHALGGALPRGDRAWALRPARIRACASTARDPRPRRHHPPPRHPCHPPARTLLDLAAHLDHRALRAATRRAQSLYRVNVRQLAAALARHRGSRGAARLAQHHRHRPRAHPQRARGRRARPHPARRPRPSRRQRGATTSTAGAPCPTSAGPSSASSSRPTAQTWHDNQLAREDDAERQALLEAHGERVLRVTWAQAIARPTRHARPAPCGGRALH